MSEFKRLKTALEREIERLRDTDDMIVMEPLDEEDKYSKGWNNGFSQSHLYAADRLESILDIYGEE